MSSPCTAYQQSTPWWVDQDPKKVAEVRALPIKKLFMHANSLSLNHDHLKQTDPGLLYALWQVGEEKLDALKEHKRSVRDERDLESWREMPSEDGAELEEKADLARLEREHQEDHLCNKPDSYQSRSITKPDPKPHGGPL